MADKETKDAFAQAIAMIQLEAQQATIERMTKICFTRCVTAPVDGKLGDKQRKCLDACTTSFLEGFQIAVRAT
jgi:hypothetical protein